MAQKVYYYQGVTITQTMRDILQHIADGAWYDLSAYRSISVQALLRRDYIVFSLPRADTPNDLTLYRITSRGKTALKGLSQLKKPLRYDGICPRCDLEPCRITRTGKKANYCGNCERELSRARSQRPQHVKKYLCPQCKQAARHIRKGRVLQYCHICLLEKQRIYYRDYNERMIARIEAGEYIPCIECGKQPRHVMNGTVSARCQVCYINYQRLTKMKRVKLS